MYDIIIIGAGPAGLTGAIYAGMANKKVLVLEKRGAGGQVAILNTIKNYPGIKETNGFELSMQMKEQAISLGAEFKTEEVTGVELEQEIKKVYTYKNEYETKNVIIATGAYAKHLEVDNEIAYFGKGLSYCATCDGNFFKDKIVTVVGGDKVAVDDAIYLSNLAKKVYLINRRDNYSLLRGYINNLPEEQSGKIEIISNTAVIKLIGSEVLEGIEVKNKITDISQVLKTDGLFVSIGRKPDTDLFSDVLTLNEKGFIEVDKNMQTEIKGVYAVGDVRDTPLRQIVTACSDGAIAVSNILKNI